MTQAAALPSDQDLIAFIKTNQPVTAGFLAYRFNVEREAMRGLLRRLRAERLLHSESVKVRVPKIHSWKYVTDWRVA